MGGEEGGSVQNDNAGMISLFFSFLDVQSNNNYTEERTVCFLVYVQLLFLASDDSLCAIHSEGVV